MLLSATIQHCLVLQELPEVDLEATVLNRLAVLEVLCKTQAQTISSLQAENERLRSSQTASSSYSEVRLCLSQQSTLKVKF